MQTLYQSLVAVNPVTLVAQIGNLFITLFFFRKFFWNKVLAILDQRREAADREIAIARSTRDEALGIKAAYEENMRQSREQADALLLSAQKTASLRSEEILREAQHSAGQIRQKAEAHIAREKKKAINDAKNEISEMALAIAGKILDRKLSAADQALLVDSFIRELGEGV